MSRLIPPVLVLLISLGSARARAHCDSLDGPAVADARAALEKGDPTPALKWVRAQDEAEVRAAFAESIAVRKLGPQAKALADRRRPARGQDVRTPNELDLLDLDQGPPLPAGIGSWRLTKQSKGATP